MLGLACDNELLMLWFDSLTTGAPTSPLNWRGHLEWLLTMNGGSNLIDVASANFILR